MADNSKRIDYIDTQGLSPKLSPEEAAKVKELKILINEVLDVREGKMDYISYFDTEHFKYRVGEEEPPYKP